MKKLNILILVNLAFAVIFSSLNICFAADISCIAFIVCALYSAILVYFLGFMFVKKSDCDKAFLCRKLIQYESFVFLVAFILRRAGKEGTGFVFDLISVICWLAVFISACIISYCLDYKHFEKITGQKTKEVKNESLSKLLARGKTSNGKKVSGLTYLKWFGIELLDWSDALLQSVFLVLLFQIFFFQFYKIPSESMVPEYMVNDRVAVSKITSGPKFPLTDVGLPCLKSYKRGDIVVFRNPHYTIDRQSEVKTVVSQLLYMFTFTMVNTNVDENGQLKADPLVKRITGVPGEQLMMQDGVLYVRTKDDLQFKPVEKDGTWAAYNLNTESPAVKQYIQDLVISQEGFEVIESIEAQRKEINVDSLKVLCKSIADEFYGIAPSSSKNGNASNSDFKQYLTVASPFQMNGYVDYSDLARALFAIPGGAKWFYEFMTDWIDSCESGNIDGLYGGNLYDDANFRLNLMLKYSAGTIVLETAKGLVNGVSSNEIAKKEKIINSNNAVSNIQNYIRYIMNFRNMPIFPANEQNGNPQFIPDNCYFMMGDNRFNSFDMRHRDEMTEKKLSDLDSYSFTYYSNVNPMYVPQKLILGSTGFRFWPLSRPVRAGGSKR